jgi:DNA-binding NtrC family response regulator
LLAEHYVKILSKTMKKKITGFSKEAMDLLCRYDWPGNVRQLENCIEKACAISDGGFITLQELRLDEETQEIEGRFREEKKRFEMNSVLYALQKHGGNRTRAADYLGIHRQQLQRYIKKYEITEDLQSAKLTATH